jgi:hypothetical protein
MRKNYEVIHHTDQYNVPRKRPTTTGDVKSMRVRRRGRKQRKRRTTKRKEDEDHSPKEKI